MHFTTKAKAYFFGPWKEPGHFFFHEGGLTADKEERGLRKSHVFRLGFDGTLAPRRHRYTEGICWLAQVDGPAVQSMDYRSSEYPQGSFLLHRGGGFTVISWWDRTQGDTRGNSNATFLLEGDHDAAVMVEQLSVFFPHVAKNLREAGLTLVDVTPTLPSLAASR